MLLPRLLASTFRLYAKPCMYNLSMPLVPEYIYSYEHELELHYLGAIKMGEGARPRRQTSHLWRGHLGSDIYT